MYWFCALPYIQENGTHAAAVRNLVIRNDISLQLADFKSRAFGQEQNNISIQFILYLANVITSHTERNNVYRKVMDLNRRI
jgi:hypothetical protein